MLKDLNKSPSSLNRDLKLLSKYQLIDISKEINSGHGIKKIIRPLYHGGLEFRARVWNRNKVGSKREIKNKLNLSFIP